MAYNGDLLVKQSGGGPTGVQVWTYGPQADAVATVRGAGYISDAKQRGMRARDVVIVIDTATPLTSNCQVSAINASTGAGTLSA